MRLYTETVHGKAIKDVYKAGFDDFWDILVSVADTNKDGFVSRLVSYVFSMYHVFSKRVSYVFSIHVCIKYTCKLYNSVCVTRQAKRMHDPRGKDFFEESLVESPGNVV